MQQIYQIVKRIPPGKVASYGQVGKLCQPPCHARQVGHALSKLSQESDIPWHRVINSQGKISQRGWQGSDDYQRILLEAEGVIFDARGKVNLSKFAWQP